MNYKLLVAAVIALMTCVASSCNKPEDQAKQAGQVDYYSTPGPTAQELGDGQAAGVTDTLAGEDQIPLVHASEGVGSSPSIHPLAMEAWNLIEISYLVIERGWQESDKMLKSGDPAVVKEGKELRQKTNNDIDTVVFNVNDKVEDLFKDAIEKEPDSPENLATYAFYLKPRRRPVENGYTTTDVEAFKLLDQAIAMEPENPLYYLLKIHAMTSPNICHNWFREYAEEKKAIQRWIDDIRLLFDKAEAAAPDNGYVNFYNAILLNKYSDPSGEFPARDEILREIKAGNRKELVNFFFAPPLPPFADVYWEPQLRDENQRAVFIDHWNQFSMHDMQDIDSLLTRLSSTMSWPEDKADIGELMVMLYQLGRTQPYDRSFFGLQLKLLQPLAEQAEKGSDEALVLADVIRYLNDQYHTVANDLYDEGKISDSAKIGVIGIHEVERGYTHRRPLAELIQGHQKAFLKHAGETMGLDFELFDQQNIQ